MRKLFRRNPLFLIAAIFALLAIPKIAAAQKFVVAWTAVSALNAPYWSSKRRAF